MKFHFNSWKSGILHFDGLLFSKSYKVSAKKVQKSYLSWHWSVMQSLKKIWLGEFSPNCSKVWKFHFDGLFLSKVYKVWAKQIQRAYLLWQWTVTQKLHKLWPCSFKMAWGIGWNFIRALKSLKNHTLMGYFCPKHRIFQLEHFRGIMCLKGDAKFKRELTRGFKNDIRSLVNFHAWSWKSQNLHFD